MTAPRSADELLHLLQAADPIPEPDRLVATEEHIPAQRTLAAIVEGHTTATRLPITRRQRRRRIIAVIVVLAAAAGIAAAWAIAGKPEVTSSVVCFSEPTTGAQARAAVRPVGTAIETCTAWWARDGFGLGGSVPPLVGCVLESGLAGVFPSDDPHLCEGLDLVPLDPDLRLDEAAITILHERLVEYLAYPCRSLEEARAFAEAQIAELGLKGWAVRTPWALEPDRPCATPVAPSQDRTLWITPGPPRRLPTTTN